MVAAPVSGACFNPAVAMLTLLHGKFMNMWVYILGPCTGSVLAWLFFHVTNPAENSQHRPAEHRSISKSVDYIISRMSIPPISDGKFAHVMSMLGMEFIGTFMITWVVALSNNVIESDRCIAIGTAVCSMVYIGGAVSGGHNNPCVTLGVWFKYFKPYFVNDYEVFIRFTCEEDWRTHNRCGHAMLLGTVVLRYA